MEFLGRYQLLERSADGPHATLIKAYQWGDGGWVRPVVLKRMSTEVHSDDPASPLKAFQHEAYLLSRMDHSGVPAFIEHRCEQNTWYSTFAWAPTVTLRELLSAEAEIGRTPPYWVLVSVVRLLADVLDYAHNLQDDSGNALGIVRGSLTPEHVHVDRRGRIRLGDWMNATSTQLLENPLRPPARYLAPEQVSPKPTQTVQTDVHSLGVLCYEFITGHPPFEGDDAHVRACLESGRIPLPSDQKAKCLPEVEAAVMRALATDPANRLQSPVDLASELTAVAEQMGFSTGESALRNYVEMLLPQQARYSEPGPAPSFVVPNSLAGAQPDPVGQAIQQPVAISLAPRSRVWQSKAASSIPLPSPNSLIPKGPNSSKPSESPSRTSDPASSFRVSVPVLVGQSDAEDPIARRAAALAHRARSTTLPDMELVQSVPRIPTRQWQPASESAGPVLGSSEHPSEQPRPGGSVSSAKSARNSLVELESPQSAPSADESGSMKPTLPEDALRQESRRESSRTGTRFQTKQGLASISPRDSSDPGSEVAVQSGAVQGGAAQSGAVQTGSEQAYDSDLEGLVLEPDEEHLVSSDGPLPAEGSEDDGFWDLLREVGQGSAQPPPPPEAARRSIKPRNSEETPPTLEATLSDETLLDELEPWEPPAPDENPSGPAAPSLTAPAEEPAAADPPHSVAEKTHPRAEADELRGSRPGVYIHTNASSEERVGANHRTKRKKV